ncbi:MAG: DUF2207 domain-containing protein [Oscillospiraceae bacterium]|nr:DUF2207 domain-containing protein [Oscillospiraceae bacterium]
MRKYIWLAAIIAFVAIVGVLAMEPFDYARITEVGYKAVVTDEPGGDGKVVVTERLTFDIHASSKNNPFWELWRDLPEAYVDGVKVSYKVNCVRQILGGGRESLEFAESPKLYWGDSDYIDSAGGLGPGKWFHSEGPYDGEYNFECLLIYVDGLYRDTVTFEIEYEMYNAALRYADSSELYLPIYSGNSVNYLKSFSGQILFPIEKMPKAGNYEAHAYGTNSHTIEFAESVYANSGYHTFSFELGGEQLVFRPYNRYIEFLLIAHGDDKHIFTQYASANDYSGDDVLSELRGDQAKFLALPQKFKTAKSIVALLCSVAALLMVPCVTALDKKTKKKHVFFQAAAQTGKSGEIPGDLDPIFAATLVFCKHGAPDNIQNGYSAAMLSLGRKGCIALEKINNEKNWDSKNVKIVVNQRNATETAAPLSPTEELYFNLILRHTPHAAEISLSSFQEKISEDYENTNSFVKNVKSAVTGIGVSQGYFQNAEYRKPRAQMKKWILPFGITGVLLLTAGNLISRMTRLDLAFGAFFVLGIGFLAFAFRLGELSKKYVLLTQFGEEERAKWRALYNFLNDKALAQEQSALEAPLWENYLIYAAAFGISKNVVKALKVKFPNADRNFIVGHPYYRSMFFYRGRRHFRRSTRSASFAARSGGYGGGARGGGGGGGGH